MGEVMSAATMTESAAMKSTVTAGKLVSIVTESTMIKSVTETISTVVWMAEATVSVSRAIGVSGISTAVAVTATWVTYVIAALSRNQTNEERQSS